MTLIALIKQIVPLKFDYYDSFLVLDFQDSFFARRNFFSHGSRQLNMDFGSRIHFASQITTVGRGGLFPQRRAPLLPTPGEDQQGIPRRRPPLLPTPASELQSVPPFSLEKRTEETVQSDQKKAPLIVLSQVQKSQEDETDHLVTLPSLIPEKRKAVKSTAVDQQKSYPLGRNAEGKWVLVKEPLKSPYRPIHEWKKVLPIKKDFEGNWVPCYECESCLKNVPCAMHDNKGAFENFGTAINEVDTSSSSDSDSVESSDPSRECAVKSSDTFTALITMDEDYEPPILKESELEDHDLWYRRLDEVVQGLCRLRNPIDQFRSIDDLEKSTEASVNMTIRLVKELQQTVDTVLKYHTSRVRREVNRTITISPSSRMMNMKKSLMGLHELFNALTDELNQDLNKYRTIFEDFHRHYFEDDSLQG